MSLLALMLSTVFFLAFDAAGMEDRIAVIRRDRANVAAALMDFAASVRKYWVVTTVFGLIVAILDVGALAIIGVHLRRADQREPEGRPGVSTPDDGGGRTALRRLQFLSAGSQASTGSWSATSERSTRLIHGMSERRMPNKLGEGPGFRLSAIW